MDYSELLDSKEWQGKRLEILRRDKYLCQKCNNKRFFEDFKYGFYKNKKPDRNYLLSIKEFDSIDFSGYRISPKVKEMLPEMGIIYFEISEIDERKWINIVAFRQINEIEINEYVNKPRIERIDLYLKRYKENGFITDNLNPPDLEFEELKNRPQKQIEIPTSEINWIDVKGLHVHHNYYIKGKLPWEYDQKALTTLCWKCHENIHKDSKIRVLDDSLNHVGDYTYCKRCHGAGWFPEYTHIQSGICFRCHGAKYEELININS